MILGFVCCSNPSGSTNNNTLDYCDICDGVQDESHEHDYCLECDGIQGSDHEHQVVTPEPEVDYCDICEGVQDESHEHDYCLECDGIQGSDHEHQEVVTPTEPTYDEYFHITNIGGENSPYKVAYPDVSEYFASVNSSTDATLQLNSYSANFKSYVDNLEFTSDFIQKFGDINVAFDTFKDYNDSANGISHVNKNLDNAIEDINNVCAPIFEEITKNIKISDNTALDKQLFSLYYKAISIEAEKAGYSDYFNSDQEAQTKYDETKAECTKYDGNTKLPFTNKYFYDESGVINPEVAEQMDLMIVAAANKMGVTANDLRNVINLSLTMNSLDAVHEYTSATTGHTAGDTCPTNTMLDVIDSVDASLISKATKLNQSIFKRDLGREMC